MKRHRVLRAATAVLMALVVVAAPAIGLAGCIREQFLVFLPGVNCDGTLNWDGTAEPDEFSDGDFVVVTALVNTITGKFCFSICGFVVNESKCCHFYPGENFFDQDLTDDPLGSAFTSDVIICSSCYNVCKPCKCISKVTYTGTAKDPDDY
jgi:hypothetical protein